MQPSSRELIQETMDRLLGIADKKYLKAKSKEIKLWAKKNLVNKPLQIKGLNEKLNLTNRGITNLLIKPHSNKIGVFRVIRNLKYYLKNAKLIKGNIVDSKNRNRTWYYFRLKDGYYLNIFKENGKYNIYSVSDYIM